MRETEGMMKSLCSRYNEPPNDTMREADERKTNAARRVCQSSKAVEPAQQAQTVVKAVVLVVVVVVAEVAIVAVATIAAAVAVVASIWGPF